MEKKTFYLTCERTWVYDTLIFAAGILGSYTYMLSWVAFKALTMRSLP